MIFLFSCQEAEETQADETVEETPVMAVDKLLDFTRAIIHSDKEDFLKLVNQDSIYYHLQRENGGFDSKFAPERVAYPYFFRYGIAVKGKGPRDPIPDDLETFQVDLLWSNSSMAEYSCTWRPRYVKDSNIYRQKVRFFRENSNQWVIVYASLDW